MTTPSFSRLCRFVGRSLGLAGFGLLLAAAPAGAQESDWIIDVPVAVDTISADHLLEPVATGPGAHSVVPVCASFVPVNRPLPPGTSLRFDPIVVDVVEQLDDGIVPPTIPVASSKGPSCTLQYGQIVEFAKTADDWLMPANNSLSIKVAVTLEPGQYYLAVESWDNHFTKWKPTDDGWTAVVQPTQTEERYRVVGTANGEVVFESAPTEDLADRTIRRTEGAIVINPALGARPFEVETGVTTSDTAHALDVDNEPAIPSSAPSSVAVTSAPAARASTTTERPASAAATPPAEVATTAPATTAAPTTAAPSTTSAAPSTTAAPTTAVAPTTVVAPTTAAPNAPIVVTASDDAPQAIATTVGSATTAVPSTTNVASPTVTSEASTTTTESVPQAAEESSTSAVAATNAAATDSSTSSVSTETSDVTGSSSTAASSANDTPATPATSDAAGSSVEDVAATTSTANAAEAPTTVLRTSDEDVFGEEYAYNLYERGLTTTGEPPSTPLVPGLGIAMLLGLIGGTSLVGGGAIALRLITRPTE